jgi:hypothetical protein
MQGGMLSAYTDNAHIGDAITQVMDAGDLGVPDAIVRRVTDRTLSFT